MQRPLLTTLFLTFSIAFANAQDTRTVKEPTIPPACTTLTAHLSTSGSDIAQSDEPAQDKEPTLDTTRIQQALDTCAKGHAVVLSANGANDAFLTGPLQLRQNITLVIAKGTTLFGSRNPAAYETAPGSCGIITPPAHPMDSVPLTGCKPLISADHVSGAGIMGDGVIDGRGGDKMLGKDLTWWGLAEKTRPGYGHQVSRIIEARNADNFTLYRITLRNSQNAHVNYNGGDGFTVWGVKIDTPKRLARNTDGIDPGNGAKNITITQTYIRTGDDNIAIKGGPGGVNNMTVSHSHFYWGHGMAIGSVTVGGVAKLRVFDLSLDGLDNAIRIKSNGSRGGLIHDIIFDDICVRNSPNPIVLDTGYTAGGELKGDFPPVMRDVTLHNIRVSGGGQISFNGYTHDYRVEAKLDNVLLTDPDAAYTYSINHADLHLGPGPVNLKLPTGTDSTIQGTPAPTGTPASCAAMFVPYPPQ
jgi:polygalacturonase